MANPRHGYLVRSWCKGNESSVPYAWSSSPLVIVGPPLPLGTELDIDPIHGSMSASQSIHSVEFSDHLGQIISLATCSTHLAVTYVIDLGPSRPPGFTRRVIACRTQKAEYLHGAMPGRGLVFPIRLQTKEAISNWNIWIVSCRDKGHPEIYSSTSIGKHVFLFDLIQ